MVKIVIIELQHIFKRCRKKELSFIKFISGNPLNRSGKTRPQV